MESSKMAKDVQTFKYNENKDYNPTSGNGAWWKSKDKDIFNDVVAVVRWIKNDQSVRLTNNIRNSRLYANYSPVLSMPIGFLHDNSTGVINQKLTLNVVKSCIDTSTSRIAKTKTRPLFLTDGENWAYQKKSKDLTKYFDFMFEELNLYQNGRLTFRNGGILGDGFLKFYADPYDYSVKVEKVLASEIYVDEVEGLYGEPRQLHQVRNIDRSVLYDAYPKCKDIIRDADLLSTNNKYVSNVTRDMVTVIESWHLPSGPNAKDGRHTICLDSGTLFAEEYKKDYFPFVKWTWSHPLVGYFGMSLAEELMGIQLEINKLLRNIQVAQHLMAVPRFFVEAGSDVNPKHLTNLGGSIVPYRGQPPIPSSPPAMAPEVYSHLENLFGKAFQITGISMMSATAQKQAGVNSGLAMQTMNDIASERFATTEQDWERFYLNCVSMVIKIKRECEEKMAQKEDYKPAIEYVPGGNSLSKMRFKDIDIPDKMMRIRAYPSNVFPNHPAGRLDKVMTLAQMGIYSNEELISLMDFPDTKAVNSRKISDSEIIYKTIDQIVEKEKFIAPDPSMNLGKALQISNVCYNNYRVQGAPDRVLNLINTFTKSVNDLIEKEKEATQNQLEQSMGELPSPEQAGLSPEQAAAPAGTEQEPPMDQLLF